MLETLQISFSCPSYFVCFCTYYSRSPFRTLPRGPPTDPRLGMYQAINPLKDYGYPSDYGLPMAFNGHSITSNPLSEFDEELEIASYNAGNGGGGTKEASGH